MIKDSGNRREYDSGAVRDIQEGKGRCDLLPLDVVANICDDDALDYISDFQKSIYADEKYILFAISQFIADRYNGDVCTAILEVSKHFEEGAKKYGEHNWEKGLPINCYIDSAVRHYLKWNRGDTDEPHDRAFLWNLMCCVWTLWHKPN